jgi:prolyl-tRNA synthetase
VKFNDADLLGIPLRATVSRRTVAETAVELRLRTSTESLKLPAAEAVGWIRDQLDRLAGELELSAAGSETI